MPDTVEKQSFKRTPTTSTPSEARHYCDKKLKYSGADAKFDTVRRRTINLRSDVVVVVQPS
jgi:hypothetical protein